MKFDERREEKKNAPKNRLTDQPEEKRKKRKERKIFF